MRTRAMAAGATALAILLAMVGATTLRALPADDPLADLVLSVSGPGLVAPGGTAAYTLTVGNVGAASASDVILTDTLPADMRMVSASHGATETLGTVTWTLGTVTPGARLTVSLGVALAVTASLGERVNLAAVTAAEPESDLTNNGAHTPSDVRAVDLGIVGVGQVGAARAGADITHTVTIANGADVDAEGVTAEVLLGPGATWFTDTGHSAGPGFGRRVEDDGVRWTWPRLGGRRSMTVTLVTALSSALRPGATVSHTFAVTAETRDDRPSDNLHAGRPITIVPGPPDRARLTGPGALAVGGDVGILAAEVVDVSGDPVQDGTVVTLDTNLGRLGAVDLRTARGWVTTTLTTGVVVGTARVSVRSGVAEGWIDVAFLAGPPTELEVTPGTVSATVGQTVTLTVRVRDRFGNSVADGTVVTGTASLGQIAPAVTGTASGRAEMAWRSVYVGTGKATVWAGAASASASVSFGPETPGEVLLEVEPAAVAADGGRATLRAQVRDRYGNPVADGTAVAFEADGGRLASGGGTTTAGMASTTFIAGSKPGAFVAAAGVGAVRGQQLVRVRPADLVLTSQVSGPRGRARETVTYPGERLAYAVTVKNDDLATARGVYLAAALADALSVVRVDATRPVTATDTPPDGLDAGTPPDHSQRFWALPDLATGEALTVTVIGDLPREQSWEIHQTLFFRSVITTTTAEASVGDLASTDQAGVYAADYYVGSSLDWDGSTVRPGGSLAYEIVYGNWGTPDDGPVRITDTLPIGLDFDHWQPDPRTTLREVVQFDPVARQVVWQADGLSARGGSLRVWLEIADDVPVERLLAHEVSIAGPGFDIAPGNNSVIDSGVRLQGVNLVVGVDALTEVVPGDNLELRLWVENRARQDPATGVVVTATLPGAFRPVSSNPPMRAAAGGRWRWDLPALSVGGRATFDVVVTVPDSLELDTIMGVAVEASARETESVPGDNRAEHNVRTVPGPAASVTVQAANDRLLACGTEKTRLMATVRDRHGHPVGDGALLEWATTNGTLSAASAVIADGRSAVDLTAARVTGEARVTARLGDVAGGATVRMVPGPPVALSVSADPAELPSGGWTTITVEVLDQCAHEVNDGWPISLRAERGTFEGGGATSTDDTAAGRIQRRLRVGDEPGALRVTASYERQYGEVLLSVREVPAPPAIFIPLALRW